MLRTRAFLDSGHLQLVILGLVLIALCLGLAATKPVFLGSSNVVAILQTMAVLCIASIGQTIAILSGGFDLSVGGVIPLAGVVYAMTSNAVPDATGVVIGITCALAAGALVGVLNGAFITRLRINPLITTLGTLSVAGGAAFVISRGDTVILDNPNATFLARRIWGVLSADVVLLIMVVIVASLVLHYTIAGHIVYAIGGSRTASERAGLRVARSTILIYVSSAMLASVAGIVAASQLYAASPSSYSDAALSTITAVILGGAALTGGKGTIVGTVLGSLLLGVIANGLNLLQINSYYQTIITGIVLLVAVGLTRARQILARSTEIA